MTPFWDQTSIKNRPKIDPKRQQKSDRSLHRFSNHFGSIWDAKLGPCWGYIGVMLATFLEKVTPGCNFGAVVGRSGGNGGRGTLFLTPRREGVPQFGLPEPMGYPVFDRFWTPFGSQSVALGTFGTMTSGYGPAECAKRLNNIIFGKDRSASRDLSC